MNTIHTVITFVVAPIGEQRDEGELIEPKKLKRAPGTLGEDLPKKYIVKKDDSMTLYLFKPDVLLAQVEATVDSVFDVAAVNRVREEQLETCRDVLTRSGADTSVTEEYSVCIVQGYDERTMESYEKKKDTIASVLKFEEIELSEEETSRTLSGEIRYAKNDLAYVDWETAFLFDPDGDVDEEIQILHIVNLQLLQYRLLDRNIDKKLSIIHAHLRESSHHKGLKFNKKLSEYFKEAIDMRLGSLAKLDAIERDIKMIGEWYQARLYALAAKKLKVNDWAGGIRTKLESLEDIYSIVSERFSVSKLHMLEMLQIILFFVLQVGWFVLIILEFQYFTSH